MTTPTLPKGVIAEDLTEPQYNKGPKYGLKKGEETLTRKGTYGEEKVGEYGHLVLYYVEGWGWIVRTLLIAAGKRGMPDRYYGTRLSDGSQVRVGNGPHVKRTINVYMRKRRMDDLKYILDAWDKGMVDANTTRDRISSRRAEGTLRRARGERSWYWNV